MEMPGEIQECASRLEAYTHRWRWQAGILAGAGGIWREAGRERAVARNDWKDRQGLEWSGFAQTKLGLA